MSDDNVLDLAEIPYPSGSIQFRYSRILSPDKTRWIRHGLFVRYSETGQIVSEGNYVLGQEQGLWRDFHSNGQLAAEGLGKDGLGQLVDAGLGVLDLLLNLIEDSLAMFQ